MNGKLKEANHGTVFYNFDYHDYLYYHGIYYTLSIESYEIDNSNISLVYKLKNVIYGRIDRIDFKGYLKAFILGIKSDLNEYDNYQKLGVAHLFTISGMHVSLFVVVFNKLFYKFNDKVKFVIIVSFLMIYGFIIGFSASVLRCLLFLIINNLNKIFNLSLSSLKVLIITLFILLFCNPFYLFDIGFIYSFLTVFGIILFSNRCYGSKIFNTFYMSFIAFLFSLPISMYSFYQINLFSIIYNIFYIPYVSLIVFPLSLLTFIFPFLSFILEFFINVLESVSKFLVLFDFSIINGSFNMIESVLFILLLLIFYYDKKYLCLVILFFIYVLVKPYFDSNAYVYYIDVGQGDSSLIIYPYRERIILLDTGGLSDRDILVSDKTLVLLEALGIKRLDYLILSHGDYDHMGDASNILDNIDVSNVIFNNGSYNELETNLINDLSVSYYSGINNLDIYDNKIYFLNSSSFGNENDDSLVMYFKIYNYNFLFMGDAGIKREEDILKNYYLDEIDFFKVGHHGSNTSSSEEFISKIKPKNCIISVGLKNRYGHPSKMVLSRLNKCNIYRTDINGSVLVKVSKNNYRVITCL